MYQKFLIGEVDLFDAAQFPELQENVAKTALLLKDESQGAAADMLVSFVKDHCINSQLAVEYPRLATLISTKELPLGAMEDLFEGSRKNPSFRKDLELYIRSGLHPANI